MLPPSTATRVRLQRRPDFGSPVVYQSWRDLLFLHWMVPASLIQETLPDGLFVDTYRGDAYVSVVPFKMRAIHLRGLPQIPGLSSCLEINLRTYVINGDGMPGVWFYSLDADKSIVVYIANNFYFLPYFRSAIQYRNSDQANFRFTSKRRNTPESAITQLAFNTGLPYLTPAADSLDFFLLERYLFFGYSDKRSELIQGRIHHKPYPLSEVTVNQCDLGILGDNAFDLNHPPVATHFSPGVDVEVFNLVRGEAISQTNTQLFGLHGHPETALISKVPN